MENDYADIKLPSKVYSEIEERAVRMLQRHNVTALPIDPFSIAQKEGYILKTFSQVDEEALTLLKEHELDAITFYSPKHGTKVIVYNDQTHPPRIRFTLMHELGHIELGHKEESDLAKKMADYFAAYALAPSPLIGLFQCDDYLDVMKQFQVSRPCALFCFQRFQNWVDYGGRWKSYEKILLYLFER